MLKYNAHKRMFFLLLLLRKVKYLKGAWDDGGDDDDECVRERGRAEQRNEKQAEMIAIAVLIECTIIFIYKPVD